MNKHDDFDNFSETDWIYYYESLNNELSPYQCNVKLTDSEKKAYLGALKHLQDERRKNPGIPINYDTNIWLE